MSTAMGAMDAPDYPLHFDVEYPEALNRWLVLVKWLLVIPHLLVLWALGLVASIIVFIALRASALSKRTQSSESRTGIETTVPIAGNGRMRSRRIRTRLAS